MNVCQRQPMRRTKTPSFRQTETSNHAPALSASNRAPAPHALPLTHRTKKTGRQPARADCLS